MDLIFPTSYSGLSEEGLRYVCRLLHSDMPRDMVRCYALVRLSGGGPLPADAPLDEVSEQLAAHLDKADWLLLPPERPVRLTTMVLRTPERKRYAASYNARMSGLPLERYLALDNLFQGYLSTRDEDLLWRMTLLLYEPLEGEAAADEDAPEEWQTNMLLWWSGLKKQLQREFPLLFVPQEGEEEPSRERIQEAMDYMLLALTGEDLTKEREVLAMDMRRAFTYLTRYIKKQSQRTA